ncbi:MAG: ABC transporter ATP-binding protein/permease [Bacilli bacterium]|jgi:ATP-binding cassette subfamily B protein|nr:ABC transporter ATP-binding protein/permease [Bacilli bacterium]
MNKLLRYLKPVWALVIVSFVLVSLQSLFALLIPSFISSITKIIENPTNYATDMKKLITLFSYSVITPTGDLNTDILIIGGIMISFAVGFLLCALASSVTIAKIGSTYGRQVRHDVFSKVNSFAISQYDKFGTASLITRTTNDIEQTQMIIQSTMRIIIMSPLTMILAIVLIVQSDPWIALIIACALPLIVVIMAVIFYIAYPLFKKFQTVIDELTLSLRQTLKGIRVIRAFDRQKEDDDSFDKANTRMKKLAIKVDHTMTFANPLVNIIFYITYIGIYFYGFAKTEGQPASEGTVAFSNVLVGAQYAMQIMNSFLFIGFLLINIPRASACAKRINEVLATPELIKNPQNPIIPANHEGIVEFKKVGFTFPDAKEPTLSQISFKTKPGSTTAIIGSTGSGKSSIINLIPRFYDVTEGSLLIDGVDTRQMDKRDLRRRLGFVPQTAQLFTGTIRSNIAFGMKNVTESEIREALEISQSADFVDAMEKGIDSPIEQDGKNLSGGQKQRIAIARALIRKPEIYVFDDSFSALDFQTDIRLRTALRHYTANSSVIIVAQRVSTIINADEIIVLEQGKIVGVGSHRELLKTCRVYQEIVDSQMDKDEIMKTINMTKALGGAE